MLIASKIVPLDVDDLLHRLLQAPAANGLDGLLQEAFTLTSLDPRRLAPPIESASDRADNMANVCETFGLDGGTVRTLKRLGFLSVTQLALIDPDRLPSALQKHREELADMVWKLNDRRPLEPLYSLKRYFHSLRQTRKEEERMKKLEFLNLSCDVTKASLNPLQMFRENFNEAMEVQSKLLVATFRSGKEPYPFAAPCPPRSSSPEQIIRFDKVYGDGNQTPRSSSTSSSNSNRSIMATTTATKATKDAGTECKSCRRPLYGAKAKRYCSQCYTQHRNNGHFNGSDTNYSFRCLNQGCQFVAHSSQLRRHGQEDCLFQPSCCPWVGCWYNGPLQGVIYHLEMYHRSMYSLYVQEIQGRNKMASKEALMWVQINVDTVFPDRRSEIGGLSRLYWEPKRFNFDGITFFQMVYRQETADFANGKFDIGKRKKRVQFCFWIWALATPKITSNYYYEIMIPMSRAEDDSSQFRALAIAKSLQTSKDSIFVQDRPWKTPRGAVFVEEAAMEKNISHFGSLNFQLRLTKS